MKKSKLEFKHNNIISSRGASMKSILWNYFCWIIAGKPDKWRPYDGT